MTWGLGQLARRACGTSLRSIAIALPTLTIGCVRSTGMLPVGPDTYPVSEHYAPIRGGNATAERVALIEANEFCERRGRKFLPVNMTQPSSMAISPAGYSVVFRCLLPNDPELQRPHFESSPELVIELRN